MKGVSLLPDTNVPPSSSPTDPITTKQTHFLNPLTTLPPRPSSKLPPMPAHLPNQTSIPSLQHKIGSQIDTALLGKSPTNDCLLSMLLPEPQQPPPNHYGE